MTRPDRPTSFPPPPAPARATLAACFAMLAFAVAVVSGLGSGNPAAQILLRALLSMVVCYLLGALVSHLWYMMVHSALSLASAAESVESVPDHSRGSAVDNRGMTQASAFEKMPQTHLRAAGGAGGSAD